MSLSNTATDYGSVTKTFHWLTACLILSAIPLGWYANQLPYDTSDELQRKALLFSLHKTIGVAAFVVALLRILWALSQRRPGLLNADNRAEATLAETVHWLLYGALLLVPLTGWIHHAASQGFAPIWWPLGQSLPFVPKNEAVSTTFAGLHIVTKWVLIGAIGFHIAGALKHHLIDRDATLRRMLPGRSDAPRPPAQHKSKTPFVAALSIWAAAIAAGAITGTYSGQTAPAPAAAQLNDVASDWQVQDGSLRISVQQLGSAVEGSFADWTAAIRFEPRDDIGLAGTVEVTISIASLTLGSVTSQALGADFFAAETFPTATFRADIQSTGTGYVASGPLTIRDQSVPVSIPVEITLAQDTAQASGSVSINRLDFGVGQTYPDESSVGFAVDIAFDMTATRAR